MNISGIVGLVCLLGLTLQMPVQADTLDTPAMLSEHADSSRLTAITRAGQGFVAVGPLGRILLGDANAEHWTQVPVPVSSDLVAVNFVDADHGWAVGHDGVILNSVDGGKSWNKQLDGKLLSRLLNDYYQPLANQGAVDASTMDVVARMSVDGPSVPILDVLFTDINNGFAVGAFNLALMTHDGGKTWIPIIDRTENPDSMHLYALARFGESIYLAGERGLLRQWSEAKQRFEVLESPYRGTFFGIAATDKYLVIYGLRGNAFASQDKGKHWQSINTYGDASITSSAILSDGSLALGTQNGKLLIGRGEDVNFKIYPTEKAIPYYGLAVSEDRSLVAVGPFGVQVNAIK